MKNMSCGSERKHFDLVVQLLGFGGWVRGKGRKTRHKNRKRKRKEEDSASCLSQDGASLSAHAHDLMPIMPSLFQHKGTAQLV